MATTWRDQYARYREFYLNIQSLYKQRADIRAFLEIILSISTVIIFLLFALKPTALTIISLYGQIQEKKNEVAALDQKLNDLQVADGVFTQNQNVIPDVDAAVTNSPRPDVISQQIQAIASRDLVNVLGVSVGEVGISGNVVTQKPTQDVVPLPDSAHEMSISITVKGDYPGISAFLRDFENLRMITKIDVTAISVNSSEQGKVIVAVISGRVPYIGQ